MTIVLPFLWKGRPLSPTGKDMCAHAIVRTESRISWQQCEMVDSAQAKISPWATRLPLSQAGSTDVRRSAISVRPSLRPRALTRLEGDWIGLAILSTCSPVDESPPFENRACSRTWSGYQTINGAQFITRGRCSMTPFGLSTNLADEHIEQLLRAIEADRQRVEQFGRRILEVKRHLAHLYDLD